MAAKQNSFKFIDLFAGIGGFRIALERCGGVCIASSEIANDAISVYQNNWNDIEGHNLGDICNVDKLPDHDLLVGGVPCQSWSIAGKNKGVEDSRGKLWYEVIRLVGKSKPKAFLFENVKGLADPRHRGSLNFLLESFRSSGYNVDFKVLNSFDYGVPQNRERIFIVGIRNDLNQQYVWPKVTGQHKYLFDVLDIEKPESENCLQVSYQRDLFGNRINVGFNKLTPVGEDNKFFIFTDIRNGPTSIHSWDLLNCSARQKEICLVILKNRRKPKYGKADGNPMSFKDIAELVSDLSIDELNSLIDLKVLKKLEDKYEFVNRRISGGINGIYRVYLPNSTFFSTLTASGTKDMIATKCFTYEKNSQEDYREQFINQIMKTGSYRALRDIEYARIQGFPLTFKIHKSYQKNVKLFGNSVSVPVIEKLGESLLELGIFF